MHVTPYISHWAVTLAWLSIHLVLLWLSSKIQAWKEQLDQLVFSFKSIGYMYGSFRPSMNFTLCMK
jgi:hypothetical protein